MIRHMFSLAVEAAKVEIGHLVERARKVLEEPDVELVPVIDEATVVVPAPAEAKPAKDTRWQSPTFHQDALKSATCPDCGEPKKVGSYRCTPCHEKAVAS